MEARALASAQGLRPAPLVHTSDDQQVHIILTNWGNPDINERVIESILESLNSSDASATPTPMLLAGSIKKANANILKDENLWKWKTVVEVVVLQFNNNILYWAQAGQPQVFLRTSRGVEPLCYTPDPSARFQQPAPLPLNGIGLDESVIVNCGSQTITPTDELLLMSSVFAPAGLYLSMTFDLQQILDLISQNIPNTPAWVGLLKLKF